MAVRRGVQGPVIRAAAIGRRLFQADGIHVHDKWTKLEGAAATVRAFLLRYTPRYVRLHPEDAARLGELGLRLEGGRVVDAKAPPAAPPPTPTPPPAVKTKESAPARK